MTNRVTEEDISRESEIEISPIIFQKEIKKDYELRVTVVGQEIFPIKIESQNSEISSLDWRLSN